MDAESRREELKWLMNHTPRTDEDRICLISALRRELIDLWYRREGERIVCLSKDVDKVRQIIQSQSTPQDDYNEL